MFAELPSRALVRVAGADAANFLQGLLSNDVEGASAARYAALLSPQGKIQFDLILIADGDGFLLDCEAARVDELLAKLKIYKMRAKVEFARDDRAVFARYLPPFADVQIAGGGILVFDDPRSVHLGRRLIGPPAEIRAALAANNLPEHAQAEYAAHRRLEGVAEGVGELGIEKLFLLEANAEELHGVDFQKGCYVGQELTSRMKRKAELKKRLLPLRIAGEPVAGANVMAGEDLLGSVIGGGAGLAFALLRLDRLAEARAKDAALTIDGAPAHLHPPLFLAGKI